MKIFCNVRPFYLRSRVYRIYAAWALTVCLAWLIEPLPAVADEHPTRAEHAQYSTMSGDIPPDQIFRKSCAVCHGERGNGNGRASVNLDPKPRDFTQSSGLTREAMINAVTYGRPGTAMMAWTRKYSEKQIESVVDYIRGRFMLVALDPRIERGRGVYGHFCQVCHGDRGQGVTGAAGGTPRDWTVPKNQVSLTKSRMIAAITKGHHGDTVNDGFADKLSADNIEAATEYIRRVLLPNLAERDHDPIEIPAATSQQIIVPPPPTAAAPQAVAAPHPAPPAAAPAPQQNAPQAAAAPDSAAKTVRADMSLPLPKGLKGDIKLGEKFFMGNCATCHGKLGNGDGPRAYFINPRPRNFHDDYSHTNLNRPTLFSVISTGKPGTVMPAWGKVLSDQEIANIAEFVFRTFVQETNGAKATSK